MAAKTMDCLWCKGQKEAHYTQPGVTPHTHCCCPGSAVWRTLEAGSPPALQRELRKAQMAWDPWAGDDRTPRGRKRRRQGREIRLVIDGELLACTPEEFRAWLSARWEQWVDSRRAA